MLALPRPSARAEDSLAYKFIDYSETGGRIDVQTQVVTLNQEMGALTQFGLTLTNDAIAGASPTGIRPADGSRQVPLATLEDHRKEWEATLGRQFGAINATLGVLESREHDYVSRGWSLNTLTDLNDKNTTIVIGASSHDDDVEAFVNPMRPYLPKHAFNGILGVTQILDPRTTLRFNVTWGRETGYLDDQYKLVEKTLELVPGSAFSLGFLENLPAAHDFTAAYASINRAYPKEHGAAQVSYRFYLDTFGVASSTVQAEWLENLGGGFNLAPDLRYYEQGAARFYYFDLDETDIVPTHVPNPNGPAYTSDYRLSSLYSVTYGLKLTYKLSARAQIDIAYDRYAMRGRDGVTPSSAYPEANIISAGAKVSW